ncbi:MAG TPA: acyltransferase [Kofleriaceae bacterium]
MQQPATGRIPTLDGIRAIAIVFVLCAHSLGTGILPMTSRAHVFGDIGVRTFFVLSGFLITTLLLRERARFGAISLRGFYLRRALRIFPAFYTFLAVVIVLRAAGLATASDRDLVFAGTYTMNFHADRAWHVGHLWSLSVEEQFYLAWPLTLIALGARRGLLVAIAAIAVAPAVRLATWYGWPELRALADQMFPCVFDALATGCVLAIARESLEASPRYRRLLDARWFWVVPLACLASRAVTRPWLDLGVTMTLANVGIALAIHRCVARPHGAVATVLEHPLAVRVGVLSYSLYLWQQLFLDRHAHAWFTVFPVNVVLAFAAATLSYRLIEAPCLRLSESLRKRRSRIRTTRPVPAAQSVARVARITAPLDALRPTRETAS